MTPEDPESSTVRGERSESAVLRAMSLQTRVSNGLAIGLMSVLGLGSLAWYYANTYARQSRARQGPQAASSGQAAADAPLPRLGRIEPPAAEPIPPTALPITLAEVPPAAAAGTVPPTKSFRELALERALTGAVFASPRAAASTGDAAALPDAALQAAISLDAMMPDGHAGPRNAGGADAREGDLAPRLSSAVTTAVKARVLPAQRLLLPKGAFIDCTLETAIDSTLPGMTTCVMATDAFGVDGKVVLLERGTKLIGETRGQVQQGAARLFVLWTEARTPTGVIVPLDSPGADELGRAGLAGEVNTHFWARFGAAILVSVIDGGLEAATRPRDGSSVVVNPAAGQDVLTEVLKNTINIPPTVVKHNGDRIQVLVARDVDFRSVYELRATARR